MKRIKSSYRNLHTLKYATPKLRKAIISNYDRDLVHNISECALNVLRGNVTLSDCQKRILILLVRADRSICLRCVCEECGRPMYRPFLSSLQ